MSYDAVKTLMRRDNLSHREAQELVNDTVDEMCGMIEAGDTEAAYTYWQEETGLEPDYIPYPLGAQS